MVDGTLSFHPAGRGARGAEGGEEERRGRGGWVEAWPGGGVGGLEGVQFAAGGRVREIAPGVGVHGGDGRVGEERIEDFGTLGWLVGENWGREAYDEAGTAGESCGCHCGSELCEIDG